MKKEKVIVFSKKKLTGKERVKIMKKFNLDSDQDIENIIDKDLSGGFVVVFEDLKEKLKIFSAHLLSKDEISQIRKKFGFSEDQQIENIVDKDLIAGFIVIFRNRAFDFSLKGRLNKLKNILYENNIT